MKSSIGGGDKFTPSNGHDLANATVLVVDDEMLVRWSLKERLARYGCTVLEADTAKAAIKHAAAAIDVVLLDFRLPDATGLDVLRAFKAQHPHVQVILMTAFSSQEDAADALALGAFNCVAKPFNLDDVAAMVETAFAARRLHQE